MRATASKIRRKGNAGASWLFRKKRQQAIRGLGKVVTGTISPRLKLSCLNAGFCIAYISANATLKPGKEWDAWYAFLTEHGMSPKPAFIGMSRGGEYSYMWATTHPDKVSCIYADNPGGNPEVLMRLGALATNDVPLLHVCGSIDPILGKFTLAMENIYQQFGGRISVMIKEGRGHHPHSLHDPKPIADFIEQSVKETRTAPPAFAGAKFTKTYYYSLTNFYRNFPSEGTYITLRGPLFAECYDRYQIELPGVEAFTTIIAPKTPAPGNPWVFRADFVNRDAVVDQALLARGFLYCHRRRSLQRRRPFALTMEWSLPTSH